MAKKKKKPQSPARLAQQAALEEMTPELRVVYDEIRKEYAAVKANEIITLYSIGEKVKTIRAREKIYGEGAVNILAAALGKQWSAVQLYDYGTIATAYSKAQIERLLKQKTSGGNSITITHLRTLAALTAAPRKAFQRMFFEDDLTTDELAAAIQNGRGSKSNQQTNSGRKPAPPKSIQAGLTEMAKYPDGQHRRIKLWDTHVFDKLQKASPEDCDKMLLHNLQQNRELHEKGIIESQHIVTRLTEAIERVERVIKGRKSGKEVAPKKKVTKKVVKKVKKKTKKKAKVSTNGAAPATKKTAVKKTPKQKIAAAKAKKKGKLAPQPA